MLCALGGEWKWMHRGLFLARITTDNAANVMPSTLLVPLAVVAVALATALIARYRPVKSKKWSLQQSRVSDQWLADHKRGRT